MTTSPRIRSADPALRRGLTILGGIFVVLGSLGIRAFEAHMDAIVTATADPAPAVEALRTAATWSLGAMALGAVALAFFVAQTGLGALRSGEFPPPGTKVLSDTPILEGAAARRRGVVALLTAIVLTGLGIVVPWTAKAMLDTQLDSILDHEQGWREATREDAASGPFEDPGTGP